MIGPTKIYYIVFGILTIAGGAMGYLKAGSPQSLIAGVICGLLLLVAAFLIGNHPNSALILGLVVSIAMLGFFGPKALQGNIKPHILGSAILAAISLAMTLVCWIKK